MMKRMMIMKGGREGTPGGGAGAGRGSSAGPRWAADFRSILLCKVPCSILHATLSFSSAHNKENSVQISSLQEQ
jgi:hypothetical protein